MKHLRRSGIDIYGSHHKRQLLNTGYFHGYKGYRFYKTSNNKLPFQTYNEVLATIQYDSTLKSLLYGKIMYIETAVKNIVLGCILEASHSESLQEMCNNVVSGYHNAPSTYTSDQKKKCQQNKLDLQKTIQSNLAYAYNKGNKKITHFYNNSCYSDVPIWAYFEIMMMGDLGKLLSCLTFDVRDKITKQIGFNTACDTSRCLIYKYIYTLKDLRNAIAHNDVIFDTRFRTFDPNKTMKRCLEIEIGVNNIDFETISDYIILICYFLKLLKVSKNEIKAFIREFEKIITNYCATVNSNVSRIVIRPDLQARLSSLKNFI